MAKLNIVERGWRKALRTDLRNNMLMDTPLGKTAFACGIAFVLARLDKSGDWEAEHAAIFDAAVEFADDYMAEGERRRASWRHLDG